MGCLGQWNECVAFSEKGVLVSIRACSIVLPLAMPDVAAMVVAYFFRFEVESKRGARFVSS